MMCCVAVCYVVLYTVCWNVLYCVVLVCVDVPFMCCVVLCCGVLWYCGALYITMRCVVISSVV